MPDAPISVRPVVPSDAPRIEDIRSAGWRAAYRGIIADSFLDEYFGNASHREARIRSGDNVLELVAVTQDDAVVGWIAANAPRDDDLGGGTVEIGACYVDPELWRGGVGAQLMSIALASLAGAGYRGTSLWVLRDNTAARAFYASIGFAPDGAEQVHDFGGPVASVRYLRRNPPA